MFDIHAWPSVLPVMQVHRAGGPCLDSACACRQARAISYWTCHVWPVACFLSAGSMQGRRVACAWSACTCPRAAYVTSRRVWLVPTKIRLVHPVLAAMQAAAWAALQWPAQHTRDPKGKRSVPRITSTPVQSAAHLAVPGRAELTTDTARPRVSRQFGTWCIKCLHGLLHQMPACVRSFGRVWAPRGHEMCMRQSKSDTCQCLRGAACRWKQAA